VSGERAPTVAFDVIGTLFSLERLRGEVIALGAPEHALELWFAQSLRDYFAYAHAGSYVELRPVLEAALPRTLALFGIEVAPPRAAEVAGRVSELDPAPGAAEACAVLADAGCRLVALSNGSADATAALLQRAGLSSRFAEVRSCDEVRTSKPARAVYGLVDAPAGSDRWMVAAHAWDTAGAAQAGLRTAWVAAVEGRYLGAYPPPDVCVEDLPAAARAILSDTSPPTPV
jgi:2-haloacid dehalogenase